MRIEIEGKENGHKKIVYNLFDQYNRGTQTSSMARTTGYTCTAVANLVLNGEYTRKGISPPEFVGEEEKCFKQVMEYLIARNIKYSQSEI
jgi:lysine 6-dehydrogenase